MQPRAVRILVTSLLVLLCSVMLLLASGAATADTTFEAAKARKAWCVVVLGALHANCKPVFCVRGRDACTVGHLGQRGFVRFGKRLEVWRQREHLHVALLSRHRGAYWILARWLHPSAKNEGERFNVEALACRLAEQPRQPGQARGAPWTRPGRTSWPQPAVCRLCAGCGPAQGPLRVRAARSFAALVDAVGPGAHAGLRRCEAWCALGAAARAAPSSWRRPLSFCGPPIARDDSHVVSASSDQQAVLVP